ncbi:sigma-70 family RNA polymerase sigma factor [Clostridium saccharoperbutylacetonicum]|uniref:sigma-70 family RNA polymerase sigma factor n=1 Tax=Clostridium saccharoperbutylacetonicum TaxID=36745 RepID=UPI000983C268|nr:sigma-70 family RNA polymerase sigma factor [Clostridium saccharoperbutylacetonicum]AQR96110.1 RNA polymerase factor sigma-70 [Clostridium saccharoperbutylacetonicum]NSB31979.1 RNA polymerase sigma factor (sigma-70 family) [Clostridium saccharoperbutylacetonicum]
MDFDYIEALVTQCRNNDEEAKEKLAAEFKPLICNISKRTFIDGYNNLDLQQECYQSLFKSVSMYNLEKHRFVAYATNAIKNNMNDLIKRIKNRNSTEGNNALSLHDNFQKDIPSEEISTEASLCDLCDYEELRLALKSLNQDEIEFIDFIFYRNNTIKDYAYYKNLRYSTALFKKNSILKKILNLISMNYKSSKA